MELTPRTIIKNQIDKVKNNISGWGDTQEDFNPVSNLGANASRKHIIRKLAAQRHISQPPNGCGFVSPLGGHLSDSQGSSERAFDEGKAQLEAMMQTEGEIKAMAAAAKDKLFNRYNH